MLGGVTALLLAATFVEAHPVPIEGISSEGISLAAVFIVGTAVIYGWAPAVIMGFLTRALIELVQRRPFIRLSYNSAVYALGGGAAGVASCARGGRGGGRVAAPAGAARRGGLLRRQHPADRRNHLALGAGAVLPAAQALDLLDGGAVLDHGLGEPHARRPLGALAAPRDCARRPARRDRALSALGLQRAQGDAARAHGSAHGARKPPTFSRAAAARPRQGAERRVRAHRLPARHRRLQADQRPLRPSGRRPRARAGRGATAPGRRGVPARRRRVRAPLAAPRRARRTVHRPVRHRPRRARRNASTAALSRSPPGSRLTRSTASSAPSSCAWPTPPSIWPRSTARDRVRVYRPDLLELAELRRLAEGPDRAARLRAAASLAHAVDARDAYTGSPLLHGRGAVRARGQAHGPAAGADRAGPPGRARCTTSASWPSPRRSCASPAP